MLSNPGSAVRKGKQKFIRPSTLAILKDIFRQQAPIDPETLILYEVIVRIQDVHLKTISNSYSIKLVDDSGSNEDC